MSRKENLKYLFQTNQEALKSLLDDISEEESLNRARGLCNHFKWQAGHLAYSTDIMTWLLGGERSLPDEWTAPFKGGAELSEDDSVFPPFSEIRGKLYELQGNIGNLLEGFDEGKFDDEVEISENWRPTRLNALLMFCEHDFYHAGQITILRKNLGRKRPFG